MGCASSNGVDGNATDVVSQDDRKLFVPTVGYVAKTKKPPSFAVNKVFVNIFHHSKVSFILCNEAKVGADKMGDACVIYDAAIATPVYNKLALLSVDEYEAARLYVAEQVIEFINKKFRESLEVSECKLPKIKRGYVGEEISHFEEEATPSTKTVLLSKPQPEQGNSLIVPGATGIAVGDLKQNVIQTPATPTIPVPSIPLPSVSLSTGPASPPSMKGNLWKLYSDSGTAVWRKGYCMLLEGKINEESTQTSLENYGVIQFKLSQRVNRSTDALTDTEFKTNTLTYVVTNILTDYVNRERNATAAGDTRPTASSTIAVGEILPESRENSVSSCSAAIVLYPKNTGSSDSYICFLCETDQDSMSWLNAMNSHIRHYYPVLAAKDEDDDPERSATDMEPPPIIKGHGKKQGRALIKTWKQRYFVAEEGSLHYYESPVAIYPYGVDKRGEIDLTTFDIQMSHNVRKNPNHQSETAESPDDCSAITFQSDVLKEKFVIVLDNIEDESGRLSSTAWFDGISAHIKYAKAVNSPS